MRKKNGNVDHLVTFSIQPTAIHFRDITGRLDVIFKMACYFCHNKSKVMRSAEVVLQTWINVSFPGKAFGRFYSHIHTRNKYGIGCQDTEERKIQHVGALM